MKKLLTIIISCIIIAACNQSHNTICSLTGEIIDRDSDTLILRKTTEDFRNHGIKIPIDDSGKFHYEIISQYIEGYELMFQDEVEKGSWQPIRFFNDNETIHFILNSMQKAANNEIHGSELSLSDGNLNKKMMDLFWEPYSFLERKLDSIKAQNISDSDYAELISAKIDSLSKEMSWFEFRFGVSEINLYGYSKFLRILRIEKDRGLIPIDTLMKYHDLFLSEFPGHPYNEISNYRLNGMSNIIVGGDYIDFTAPDSEGNNISISEIIFENDITLIDLWASWCGPCIYKSKKNIPIYEEFKDSGFEIIAVVGGIGSQEQYMEAIKKQDYPWTVLAEIDDGNDLWNKYNIPLAGGGQFLVNNIGEILAINPKPDELRKILDSSLK